MFSEPQQNESLCLKQSVETRGTENSSNIKKRICGFAETSSADCSQTQTLIKTAPSSRRPLPVLSPLPDLWPWLWRFIPASNPLRVALSSFSHAWSCTETPANWHRCQYRAWFAASSLPQYTQRWAVTRLKDTPASPAATLRIMFHFPPTRLKDCRVGALFPDSCRIVWHVYSRPENETWNLKKQL